MASRMQQRRGTAAQWAAANPVLADGEEGYEKDTKILKIGDGVSTWNQLPSVLSGMYLPVNGKAYDSDRLDGLDSTAFAQQNYVDDRILPAGASRTLVTHFGSVTTFPTTGVKLGDRCNRSDLFCEMYYTGSAWQQVAAARMTSVQRAAFTTATKAALYDGFRLYETDTLLDRRWDGRYWEITGWRGIRSTSSGSGATGTTSMPLASFTWANANVPSQTNMDFANWTNVYMPIASYANAGDGPGGPALFTYINAGTNGTVRCNAKGRVRLTAYSASDMGFAGISIMNTLTSAANGQFSSGADRRIRTNGFTAAGSTEQWLDMIVYVDPGDTFGLRIWQANTNNAPCTYSTTILQVEYI